MCLLTFSIVEVGNQFNFYSLSFHFLCFSLSSICIEGIEVWTFIGDHWLPLKRWQGKSRKFKVSDPVCTISTSHSGTKLV